jgi:long-chain acyl-CoA synthetase
MLANTLFDFLTSCSLKFSSREAIVFGDTRITYEYFMQVVDRLAAGLAMIGVSRGHRIAVMLPNVPQFPIVYFTLLKLGVWVVPVNVLFKEAEVQHLLDDARVDGFVAWDGFSRYFTQVMANPKQCRLHIFLGEKIPPNAISLTRLIATAMQRFEHAETASKVIPAPDDPAVVLYTAGTTGSPKGAVLSHANLVATISACWRDFSISPEDRFLAVVPLFHGFGQMMAMNVPLSAGATTVLLSRFDPQIVTETIARERITHFIAVPSMFSPLLQLAPEPEQLSSLRCCIVGGSLMPARVRQAFEERYHVPIYECYGLAECGAVVTAWNAWMHAEAARPCAVGMPLLGLEVAVFREAGRQASEREIGEIAVRGRSVMQGYLDRGEMRKDERWQDWLFTGDVGMMDGEGYLYWVDRKQDVIFKESAPVYPSEVEAVLLLHPKVEECAVIGVPDRPVGVGEEVKAYIVLRSNQYATKEELVEFCKSKLAAYKCPRHIEFGQSLPRSVTGKVLKHLLRERKPAPATPVISESQPAQQGGVQTTNSVTNTGE